MARAVRVRRRMAYLKAYRGITARQIFAQAGVTETLANKVLHGAGTSLPCILKLERVLREITRSAKN